MALITCKPGPRPTGGMSGLGGYEQAGMGDGGSERRARDGGSTGVGGVGGLFCKQERRVGKGA